VRGCLKIAFLSIAIAVAVFAGLAFWASRHSFPPMPKLAGKIERGVVEHGGRVPEPENMAVTLTNQPVSMLIMNGTGDPFNPWRGGDVVLYGVWGNRGPVLSAQASIDYFRNLAGLEGAPHVTQFPDLDPGDGSTAERSSWSAPGKRSVALYTIKGGGHSVPHPAMHGWRLLGNSNRDIHAANEIWEFFQSAP
jgi:polyhydroxybutyrate depolymerase